MSEWNEAVIAIDNTTFLQTDNERSSKSEHIFFY